MWGFGVSPAIRCLTVVSVCLIAIGCVANTPRLRTGIASNPTPLGRVAVLRPMLDVMAFDHRARTSPLDERAVASEEVVWRRIVKWLVEAGVDAYPAPVPAGQEEELNDILALYRVVDWSIIFNRYGPDPIPGDPSIDGYGIGPIAGLLESLGADSLVIVTGADQHATGSWVVKRVLDPEDGVAGDPRALLRVAVIDGEGRLLAYNLRASKLLDLDGEIGVEIMLDVILSEMPFWGTP